MPKTYSALLKDPRWQKKRLKILERDNWTCRDTGDSEQELQVHHCWYAKGSPWETPDEYLLALSKDAHFQRQTLESRGKKALGRLFALSDPAQLEEIVESLEWVARRNEEHNGEGVFCTTATNYDFETFFRWFHLANQHKQRSAKQLVESVRIQRSLEEFCS